MHNNKIYIWKHTTQELHSDISHFSFLISLYFIPHPYSHPQQLLLSWFLWLFLSHLFYTFIIYLYVFKQYIF